jgi:CubicO group peptidase (beta-lactamase class C family)
MNRALLVGATAIAVVTGAVFLWLVRTPSTMAVVPGVEGPLIPRLSPADARLDDAALAAAAEAAFARGARAFVVGRRGHVIYERYAPGEVPTSTVALSANPVLALALGIALDERFIASIDAPVGKYLPAGGDARGVDEPVSALVAPIDAPRIARVIEQASGEPLPQFLSSRLWVPLGAAGAHLDDRGQLVARIEDWMRIGELLAADGVYQGEDIISPGWARSLSALAAQSGALSERGVLAIAGDDASRLWVVPALGLAVLAANDGRASSAASDDGLIPIAVIGSVLEMRAAPGLDDESPDPADLVPSH